MSDRTKLLLIASDIKKNVNNHKRAWTTIDQECVAQYNKTIHSSTGFTPEYVLYGKRQQISPLSSTHNSTLEEDRKQAFLNSTKVLKLTRNE